MMNKIYRSPRILVPLALLLIGLALVACERPDVYALVENLMEGKGSYSFSAELNVKVNDTSNSAAPENLVFKIDGKTKDGDADIDISLVEVDGESVEFKVTLHKRQDILCFAIGELSGIVSDLLGSCGIVDMPAKILFDELVSYEGASLYIELEDFELDWFEKYGDDISKALTVKSSVSYDHSAKFEIPKYEYDWDRLLSFAKIKTMIEKDLLKLPYYRYSELYIVLETDDLGESYMNILATRERGGREILEKFRLDCDLSKVRENPELVYSENILPMRYLMELLGESVGWDAGKKLAYVLKGGNKIYYDGALINSTTYIPLNHFIARTDYIVNSVVAGEYIEFKLIRR
ncbi:MAG: copper amine oxidase N-terminal domain-containing protein [Oscillospiraceae bacterium]|nr:copper amine oxidase N-terminal domain-containing protein [Oscillospiraceae bacterium]